MKKHLNLYMFYIIVATIISVVVLVLFLRSLSSRHILASITPFEVVVGEAIQFTDSTDSSSEWLWEFGDGQMSTQQSGSHMFNKVGTYKTRLTVDSDMEHFFEIKVKESINSKADVFLKILGPTVAMQGEKIIFKGVGEAEQWRWEMGESGIIDSRDKSTIYTYANAGVYEVLLTTESTQYPIRHIIKVEPNYNESDSLDIATKIGRDIRDKLQNIVDGESFNINYSYVVDKYFNGDQSTLVTINSGKYNDFYSYCQGLRQIGIHKLNIETVLVEIEDSESGFVTQITVRQKDKIIRIE